MFPAECDAKDDAGHVLVTAYALHRPDSNWSLMLVNRDPSNAHTVQVIFETQGQSERSFSEPVAFVTFGSEQYAWKDEGPSGRPDPDGPPEVRTLNGGANASFTLPKASITVLRGAVAEV